VVDPALLGEVTEVPRRAWRPEFPKPIKMWISETEVSVVPDVEHWSHYPAQGSNQPSRRTTRPLDAA
jgi:hypothetical protein